MLNSINWVPKPIQVGGTTTKLAPASCQASTTALVPSTALVIVEVIETVPPPAASAPYFKALVDSSLKIRESATTAFPGKSTSSPDQLICG